MDLRSVDLNLLVTFDAIFSERSVSRAANRLGLTQPAVSHALRRLRKVFRDELLVRGPGGMEPTARAVEIASVIAGSLSNIEQIFDQQHEFDPKTSPRNFTLHVSDYVAPYLLPHLCAVVRTEAPAVTLEVDHFRRLDGRVEPNEVHVRVLTREEKPAVATEDQRLLEDEYVVLMSRHHPQARSPLTLASYLELRHVKVSAAAVGTNDIDDALTRRGVRRRVALTVPSWFDLREVIAKTDLVVAMPRRWASEASFSAGCIWQSLPLEEVKFVVDLRWRSRDAHDPGNLWLRRLISNIFDADSLPR